LRRKADYTKYHIPEKFGSYLEAIDYRTLTTREHKVEADTDDGSGSHKKLKLEYHWTDNLFKSYLATGVFYYLVDICIKFCELKYPTDYLDHCKLAFLIHHIITVLGFKAIWAVDQY
jgi:hypothetical protein